MANILNTGFIPQSTANFAPDYTLGDATIGKFISLNGSRKFYNPGIGLTLSSPNSGITTNVVTMINKSDNTNALINMSSNTKGATAFVGYPDSSNPTGDVIPGFVNRTTLITDYTNSGQVLLNSASIHPDPSIRLMNILTPGDYVFKANGSGIGEWASYKAFNFDFTWYINVNGVELNLETLQDVGSTYVGGLRHNLATINWTINNYVSPTFTLKTGDYVQLYCKSIGATDAATGTFTINTLEFDIQLTTSAPPAQSTFNNSLNIADFKTNSINLYGANRDTLVLQGTKLTNL